MTRHATSTRDQDLFFFCGKARFRLDCGVVGALTPDTKHGISIGRVDQSSIIPGRPKRNNLDARVANLPLLVPPIAHSHSPLDKHTCGRGIPVDLAWLYRHLGFRVDTAPAASPCLVLTTTPLAVSKDLFEHKRLLERRHPASALFNPLSLAPHRSRMTLDDTHGNNIPPTRPQSS